MQEIYGILAGVSGNLRALHAALDILAEAGATRLLCLGDLVGHHPLANECIECLRLHRVQSIAGDHDLIAIRRLGAERRADEAAHALRRTRRILTPESRAHLAGLPCRWTPQPDVLCVHAAPADLAELAASEPAMRLGFFARAPGRGIHRVGADGLVEPLEEHGLVLDPDSRYLVNPGSVDGSRRRGGGLAECALYDPATGRLGLLERAYDQEAVDAEAAATGFHEGGWIRAWSSSARRGDRPDHG
jgi:hypothetical protein